MRKLAIKTIHRLTMPQGEFFYTVLTPYTESVFPYTDAFLRILWVNAFYTDAFFAYFES